jgi:hypothetical protein
VSRSAIPARAPYGEVFPGAVVRHHGRIILTANPAPERDVLARGVVIRYGVRYLEKHFLSVVPGLIALERGELFTGEDALDFLVKRSNLYPRTEVYGYRSDGADEMKTVKWLDVAEPLMVLAYANDAATSPVAEVDGLSGPEDVFTARMLAALPRYESLDAVPSTGME